MGQQQQSMPQKPGMMSGMGGMMATGMALGAGSAVGHMAVSSMMGGGGHGGGHGGGNGGDNGGNQGNSQGQGQQQQEQFSEQQPMPNMGNMTMNPQDDKCFNFSNIFNDCMKYNQNNSKVCEQTFEDLKTCQNPSSNI